MFEKLQHKKGSASLYLLLLAAAVGIMLMLKECSAETLPPRNEAVASGDTLNVAIEISPVGVTMDADTLSGTYYNIVRQICSQHNRPVLSLNSKPHWKALTKGNTSSLSAIFPQRPT